MVLNSYVRKEGGWHGDSTEAGQALTKNRNKQELEKKISKKY
jgi:hypothetical protein